MTPRLGGIIIVPMVRPSSTELNRNFSFANANPASVQNSTVPSATELDTITELMIALVRSTWL